MANYEFLDSVCELYMLAYLTPKVVFTPLRLPELIDESILKDEILRIKNRAAIDIRLFDAEPQVYLFRNLIQINDMIITLMEILVRLPKLSYMTEPDRYQYKYGTLLRDELGDLSEFFNTMSDCI